MEVFLRNCRSLINAAVRALLKHWASTAGLDSQPYRASTPAEEAFMTPLPDKRGTVWQGAVRFIYRLPDNPGTKPRIQVRCRGPSLRDVRLYLLDFVKLSDTFRPRLCRLSFVFVGLAICVFSWGLQYKLSLYYPKHSTYHQLPEAKLLSKNEQPAATEGLLMTSAKPVHDIVHGGLFTLTLFVWVLGLLPISGATPTEPERTRPWLQSLSAGRTAFFFRPPPTFVFVSNS
jgi:hypothetical protein